MNGYTRNKIVTLLVMCMLVIAVFSKEFVLGIARSAYNFVKTFDVTQLISDVDESSRNVSYKSLLLDMNSMIMQKTGVKKIIKSDMNVLRLENGYLCYEREDISDEMIKKAADLCIALKAEADELNIPFLYVYAPYKIHFDDAAGAYSIEDQEKFLSLLEEADIHVLNVTEHMKSDNMSYEDCFFVTDHHWKPQTGLWVSGLILDELSKYNGFTFDKEKYNIENYNVKIYENAFLGSLGKKAGRYFTPIGLDDFPLVTPKFETEYTYKYLDRSFSGSFEKAFLKTELLNRKDMYSNDLYNVYCHGNYPITTIENELAQDNDKSVFVIKDSYANTVLPYLSSSVRSVTAVDLREKIAGKTETSVFDFIRQSKPDYVIVLYSGVDMTEDDMSKYSFK